MKVYVVISHRWESEIEAIFATRAAAEADILRIQTAEHEKAVSRFRARAELAERWVAAGGGLDAAIEDPGTLEVWLAGAADEYSITEYDVQGAE